MKKKFELKEDDKSFERFDNLVRRVVSVPKSDIDKQEKATKTKTTKTKKKV